MTLFDKLSERLARAQSQAGRHQTAPVVDDAVAGFGTPAGIGTLGGARDIQNAARAVRTHTGRIPQDFVAPVEVTDAQRQTVAMAASVLLNYPGADFEERVHAVESSLAELPADVQCDFGAFLTGARRLGRRGLEEHYVEIFDQRRRCSLFLSYYAVGDTRQRGMAIVSFQEQLESLGFSIASDELADHLCVVLEAVALSAGEGHARAVELLASHREGLEVLRTALSHFNSPYVHLIVAVCRALPEVGQDTAQKYLDLIRTGPPAEMVGIADLPFPTTQPDLV